MKHVELRPDVKCFLGWFPQFLIEVLSPKEGVDCVSEANKYQAEEETIDKDISEYLNAELPSQKIVAKGLYKNNLSTLTYGANENYDVASENNCWEEKEDESFVQFVFQRVCESQIAKDESKCIR